MNRTYYVAVKFLTELLVVVALYVHTTGRRRYFSLRLVSCLALCFLFSAATSPFVIPVHQWEALWRVPANILRYSGIYISLVASVWVCFRVDIKEAVFICTGAYAIQHLVLKVHTFIEPLYFDRVPFPVAAALYAAFVLGSFFCFDLLIIRRLQRQDSVRLKSNDTFRFNLLMILSLIVLSVFSGEVSTETVFSQLAFAGYGVICSVFLLCMQFDMFSRIALEAENEQIEYILTQERKQFEAFRAGVEYLDIKCHDLKHQIHRLKTQPAVDEAVLTELESGIAAYESYANTGCPALDITLGEKYLQCAGSGIPFVCAVSSQGIDRLSPPDIYSLFGNALDNAIEYESALPEEKRFIRLSVRDMADMLFIRVENYYEGPPIRDGEEIHTTKEDRRYHGFGLKSMRHIAAKYGGEMGIETHDGLFCLTFVFTLP